jgi:hypothetical protein
VLRALSGDLRLSKAFLGAILASQWIGADMSKTAHSETILDQFPAKRLPSAPPG